MRKLKLQLAKGRSRRRQVRCFQRFLRALLLLPACYLLVVFIGLIPVNRQFEPTPNGIEIFLVSSAVHADIALPIATDVLDWRDRLPARYFSGDTRGATLAVIGWGDREFFTQTPTWSDLRILTALKALFWPTESCLHVSMATARSLPKNAKSVKISVAQYEGLVAYINRGFRSREDGSPILIPGVAYSSNDAFFEARGKYNCLNTCNTWVGRAMQVAGIRTGWFTPLPKTMFFHLPG